MNVIQKYGKGGGRGGRTSLRWLEFYFDASLFVYLLSISLFLSLSLLGCLFPSSSSLKGTSLIRMEYCFTSFGVGLSLFNVDLLFIYYLYLCFFVCLVGCLFPSSSSLKGTSLIRMEYCFTSFGVGLSLFNVDLLFIYYLYLCFFVCLVACFLLLLH